MSDFDELLNNLENLPDYIEEALLRQMRIEAKRVQAAAKLLAPVGNPGTGQLRNSITADALTDVDGSVVGEVGTNVEYAPYVEFGTGPVGAASDKDLPPGMTPRYRSDGWTYKDPKTGKFVYTKGQPANPFLYPAFRQTEKTVRENLAKAVKNAMKEAGDG